jgi:predicted AlkP superfamily phosphohydrolase/phosphomutase
MNSKGWRARSIWDILGEKGYTVGVIAWLVTWPALPVNGYCVTDRITYSPEDGYPAIPDLVYPPELEQELAPLRASMTGTTNDEIEDLVSGDLWREGGEGSLTWGGVQTVKSIYASDETVRNVALHMLETREQPDFFAVYFLGVDRVSHRFWGQMRPWTVDMKMPDEVIEAFEGTVPGYYERADKLIGEILDAIDEDSTVIVCSDHGFRGPLRTKEGLQLGIQMHRDIGILAAMGPGIRKGAELTNASVLDLTPTILALLGEPVGRDMDGFVLTELLDEDFMSDKPVEYVDTYEKESAPDDSTEPIESELDDAIKEELRSLGYIE